MQLGEFFISREITTEEAIEHALRVQKDRPSHIDERFRRIGNVLLLIGEINEEDLVYYYKELSQARFNRSQQTNDARKALERDLAYIATTRFPVIKEIHKKIPVEIQIRYEFNLLAIDSKSMQCFIGVSELNQRRLEEVRSIIDKYMKEWKITFVRIFEVPLYTRNKLLADMVGVNYRPEELELSVDEIVQTIYRQAIQQKASDISFEPHHDKKIVRIFKNQRWIDLKNVVLTDEIYNKIRNYFITDAGIAQSLTTQKTIDGEIKRLGRYYEYRGRMNIINGYSGHITNIRILPDKLEFLRLEDLGYSPRVLTVIRHHIKYNKGLILVTGRTNSGKNVSIFSMLSEKNKNREYKILSLERPVEYKVPNVIQIDANTDADYDSVIQGATRQTPNVLYISEINNLNTMEALNKFSNSGNLAVSTMHLSGCQDLFSRAKDLAKVDVSGDLITNVLLVLNQILVEKACPRCLKPISQENYTNKAYVKKLKEYNYDGDIYICTGVDEERLSKGDGKHACPRCKGLKTIGLTPVAEYVVFSEELKYKLRQDVTISDKTQTLIEEIMNEKSSLMHDGLNKMKQGNVTIDTLIEKGVISFSYRDNEEDI